MIIKSARKASRSIDIKIADIDGSCHLLEKSDHIKYLGVMIDDILSWKYHISYVCSRVSRNIGIISKIRHYLSIHQLKQIYYNLIYPYLSYAVTAWGSAYKTHLQKLQTKQNTVIRLMFFATTSGPHTESALPYLNLLDILTVNNVYRLQALKFTHMWHKGLLPRLFDNLFQYASSRHTYNTRYASKKNFCKPRPRTNIGKQMFSYQAIDFWNDIPLHLKDLSTLHFANEVKHYLL